MRTSWDDPVRFLHVKSRWKVAIVFALSWLLVASLGLRSEAQGPGTPPPASVFQGDNDREAGDSGGLPVKGFMFLDESGTGVMVPQMTYERWHELESGVDGPSQAYAFDSLDIDGTVEKGRAELQVTLRLTIDATDGRKVAIPLRMGNFHRLSSPDVSGVDEHEMTVASENGGHVLWVRADKKREAVLKMNVSARIDEGSISSLPLRLPDVPSTVTLITPGRKVTGEVVGRGDEVLQTEILNNGRSRLRVESGGGTFMLRWGSSDGEDDTSPLLEVDSRVDIRWLSPDDQPIASVQLIIRNLRGAVSEIDIRLPPGAVVLDAPVLGASGQLIDVTNTINTDQQEPLRIVLPEQEQQQRVDLDLELQLANTEASATSPLILQVPDVIGAIRQRGEIHIQTSADYRLRWLARQWVQSVVTDDSDDLSSGRLYSFQFDRGDLRLPIWLSAKQRRLRLTSEMQIMLSDSLATMELIINASGQISDGRGLRVDLRGWKLRSILDVETGEELDYFATDQYQEIEMNPRGADDPAPVRILAERNLDAGDSSLQLPLPVIVKVEDNQVVQMSTVVARGVGRASFVVDLAQSTSLDRLGPTSDLGPLEPDVHRFRVLPPDAPATLAGIMVQQPPRLSLSSSAMVAYENDSLNTSVDWLITSISDLEGRLPIQIPDSVSVLRPIARPGGVPAASIDSGLDAGDDAYTSEKVPAIGNDEDRGRAEASVADPAKSWTVTVEDSAAVLRHIEGTRYELISDRLGDGTMSIRWWKTQNVDWEGQSNQLASVVLPRPTVADVTMQGDFLVTLIGDQKTEISVADSSAQSELVLDSIPREALRVRVSPKKITRSDQVVLRAVLRTAVGQNTRQEQVIATVEGGESFDVGLSSELEEVVVEAFVDGQSVIVNRIADQVRVPLVVDEAAHVVDLRIWISDASEGLLTNIEPRLQLPVGIGRVYWQLIVPLDSHLLWASPTLGRSMTWQFDRWRLARQPIRTDQVLSDWAGATEQLAMPPGNRYLYLGTEPRSFRAAVASRGTLWLLIAGVVLFTATVLTYVPQTRHPMTAVIAAILLAGLMVVAPDAAVLAGQVAMIAMVLVVVMTSIRALMTPRRTGRALTARASKSTPDVSTRAVDAAPRSSHSSIATTENVPVTSGTGDIPPATEVSS